MRIFLISLTLLLSSNSFAAIQSGADYRAEASAQAYPLGGMLTVAGGYNYELWQKPQPEDKNAPFWQYGYIRPAAELKTSFLTHRFSGALEFYPISILGLSLGGGMNLRNYNGFKDFDCTAIMCDHALRFQFAQAKLIVGYEKWAGVFTARYDQYRAEKSTQPFYEEMSYLVGQAGQDDQRTLQVLALYKQDATWSYGTLAIYQQFIGSQNNSSSVFAVSSYADGPWRINLGLGEFHSSHQTQRMSGVLLISYIGAKGIGLAD